MSYLLLQTAGRRIGKALRGLTGEEVVVVACSPSGGVIAYEVARILRGRMAWCPFIPLVNEAGEIVGGEAVSRVAVHPHHDEATGEPLYEVPPIALHRPPIHTNTSLIVIDSEWWQGSWGLYAILEELGVTAPVKRLLVCGAVAPSGVQDQLCPPAHTTLFLDESQFTLPTLPDPEWLTSRWTERQFTNLARVRSRSKRYTSS